MPHLSTQGGAVALTIAGFDPSSGAGATADLAVFAAHGIFGTAAITALTVQSTVGVERVEPVSGTLLRETLRCLHADLPPDGIKIGMLGGEEQVLAVAEYVASLRSRSEAAVIVLDPVLVSSSGAPLLSADGFEAMMAALLPLAHCVTPNTQELTRMTGLPCETEEQIAVAMRWLCRRYPGLAVLATGGHRAEPDDMLLAAGVLTVLKGERVETRATHGTGCALSSALLCRLLGGRDYLSAAAAAKAYVTGAMQKAMPRGRGNGPMHLLWPLSEHASRSSGPARRR